MSAIAPSASPAHGIEIAVVAALKLSPAITAIVGDRVFTSAPEGTPFPLVLVEGVVETPANMMRRRGASASIQVRAGAQERGTATVHAVISAAKAALDGAELDVGEPFRPARCEFDNAPPPYADTLAGVQTWYRPAIFRVRALQSA